MRPCYALPALLVAACAGSIGGTDDPPDPTPDRPPAAPAGMDGAGGTPVTPPLAGNAGSAGTTLPPSAEPLPRLPPPPDLKEAFTCASADGGSTPRRLWRLSSAQYRNTIAVFLNGRRDFTPSRPPSAPADLVDPWNPPNTADEFSNIAGSYSMGDGEMRLALQSGRDVAGRLVAKLRADGSCLGKMPYADCVRALVQARGPLLFRRPMTAEELSDYAGVASANLTMLGEDRALATVFQMMLLSPGFLYRVELGGMPDAAGLARLTPYEVAAALSYAFLDAPPDDPLWRAAEANQLTTPEQIRAQIERLMTFEKTVNMVKTQVFSMADARPVMRFIGEYFPYQGVHQVFKDPKRYPFHKPDKLVEDTEALLQDVLARNGRRGFLEALLAGQQGFVHGDTAPSYSLDPTRYNETTLCKEPKDFNCARPNPVTFPAGQRAGLLTQPSFLAAISKTEETEPVQRGRFVAEHLLCRTVPDLPIGQVVSLPDLGANATMREKLAVHTKDPACTPCHQMMDPLGLAFEVYDHLGRHRTLEGSRPIDASGAVSGTTDRDGAFKDAFELMGRLAASTTVSQCFVRHAFTYWMGRPDGKGDGCTLVGAHAAFTKASDHFELLASLFSSRSFLYRSTR